jgi:NifU-like protein involved in Fe-S cluster formation
LLPKYIDDILVDIRFECIGSLIYQVILDLLLDRCIGLTKNEVKNTIRNISTYELVSKISNDINEIDRYVDIEILKHRLLNNI